MKTKIAHFGWGKDLLWAGVLAGLSVATTASAADYSVRGLTEPIGDVILSASIPGIVTVIHQGEGTFVEAGMVLLELDKRMEELEIQRKQVEVETLRAETERSELLFNNTKSIPREEVEKKRGEMEIALVELDLVREQLAKRVVKSPISGVVTLVPIKVGEYCQTGETLVRVVDVREFYCVANVDEARVPDIRVGSEVRLEVSAARESVIVTGEVVFVSPVVDPGSGLLRIKAQFQNPDGRIRPGVAGALSFPE